MRIFNQAVMAIFLFAGATLWVNATAQSTTSGSAKSESKAQRNKRIALHCIKAWNENNMEEILKHLAVNTVDYGDGSTPPARGIDSARMFMELWRSSVNEYRSDNEIAVAEGDYVFIYADWSGSFKTDFMGMKTAGKSFKFTDVDIMKFDDQGKITEHRALVFSRMLKELAGKTD